MGRLIRISGPLVYAEDVENAKLYDVVKVGEEGLIGEIIRMVGNKVAIQVYEDTTSIRPGEKVVSTENPLSVELGPGILGNIYDGIQRPLNMIEKKGGIFIKRGINVHPLDRKKKWKFTAKMKKGDNIEVGDILGEVEETPLITHKVLSHYSGKLVSLSAGTYTVEDEIGEIETRKERVPIKLYHRWVVRKAREYTEKLPPVIPLITGQRIIDTFFPIAKGGTACIPGGFGTGKTVCQQTLAKWADARIIVYIGCGERGNEMTEVLTEFPKLIDPKSKRPIMERTVLIANTSNMPVAAREASIYTGITLAEYYRDMGYDVALMADSTSRWAEAMREIGGRLEEMPGEEGYPSYLARKLAEFYERAGRVRTLGRDERYGSVSVIGAVSPPGGDLSEPVAQSTLRVTKVFLALDSSLAQKRHFPAINWLKSYSLYTQTLDPWFEKEVSSDWSTLRKNAIALLQKDAELQEIVQLVGPEALPEKEQGVLLISKMLKEDFLQQSAYHDVDTYANVKKQYEMLKTILLFFEMMNNALNVGVQLKQIAKLPVLDEIVRMKEIPNNELGKIEGIRKHMEEQFDRLAKG